MPHITHLGGPPLRARDSERWPHLTDELLRSPTVELISGDLDTTKFTVAFSGTVRVTGSATTEKKKDSGNFHLFCAIQAGDEIIIAVTPLT